MPPTDAFSAFTQSNRLLKLTLAPGSGIDENTLLPYELAGTEGIAEGFTYTLTCLAADAFLELKQFLGLPIQLAILTDDGAERALCGIVTAVRFDGTDGGFARFTLTLQDPLAVLALRINSRVFQDLSVPDIAHLLLDEHRQKNSVLASCFAVRNDCLGTHPPQSWVTQYNESDARFLSRLLVQEGIAWYVEHGEAGLPGEHPTLTLVLFDDAAVLPPASAARVRFHRADGSESEDVLTDWHAARRLQAGRIERASYEYKAVTTNTVQKDSRADQGDYGQQLASTLEDVRYDSHHAAHDFDDYERYGKLRMAAHDYASKCFTGFGTQRALAVGQYFSLTQHPVHDQDLPEQRQFTITRQSLYARNNLPDGIKQHAKSLLTHADGEKMHAVLGAVGTAADIAAAAESRDAVYRTRIEVVRRGIPIVPAYSDTEHAKPIAPALLTATVVGPPGEEIHVNELGCYKVRMDFTRRPDHAHAAGAGASNTDRDSIWIRGTQPWTGAHYGHLTIPRVGDEILLTTIDGDIDRVIVTGYLPNGTHRPATFSNAGSLPGNKAISGIKSKMYRGSGCNEILWDDSTGEQRIRVATDHVSTALNLGYLVHPRKDGKGEPRGEGVEVRTDAFGALRAGKGMLLSTEARDNAKGSHLDSQELHTQVQGSLELSQLLSDTAQQHLADPLHANADIERLAQHISHTYPQSGGTGQHADVPGYAEPILALSSPAGMVSATPKSQQRAAGEHLHLSSQQDTNMAVGKRLVMAVKEAFSAFVATSGIKLFAGKGKVQIQAHDDAIEMLARENIDLSSIAGDIDFAAAKSITLTAGGGCQIRIADGQIWFKAPGKITINGQVKNFAGPEKTGVVLPTLPNSNLQIKSKTTQLIVLADEEGHILKNRPYRIWMKTGEVIEGVTDRYGATKVLESDTPTIGKIEILKRLS